ncbi:outer membrane protein assembly factor BamB family protein [Streptomyces sp. NPDC055099]
MAGVVVAALVAALCAGGGYLWLGAGGATPDGDKPGGTPPHRLDIRETVEERPGTRRGQMAFRFSVDDMSPGEEYEMPGTWATDKILAKGINKTLVGFKMGDDATTGDEAWRTALSGPICGTTRHVTVEARTAVLHRSKDDPEAPCDRVTFFDIDTGEKVWGKTFPTSETLLGQDPTSVSMTRGTVAVAWGNGSMAYDMDTGDRLWKKASVSGCEHRGLAGGRGLLMLLACAHTKDVTFQVHKLDPRTGDAKWTYLAARGIKGINLLSAEPAVIAPAAGDSAVTHLISIDDHGKRRATIGLGSGRYVVNCDTATGFDAADDCPSTVVSDDQVFVMSREDPHGDMINNSNHIVSFDLATGKTVKKFESGSGQLLYPMRMSGDQLLAYRESSDHITPMGLTSLDPRTGKETPYFYFDLPVEGWTLASVELSDVVIQDGRLFFGSRQASGPSAEKKKEWSWLVIGIEGAKR